MFSFAEDTATYSVLRVCYFKYLIKLLLTDGAKRAKEIIANFTPEFATKEEFLAYIDAINCSGDRIAYNADGTATFIANSNQSIAQSYASKKEMGFEV